MLIDSNGVKKGLMDIDTALKEAQAVSMDLVQVSAIDSDPIVCKILDYGKSVYEKKKISQPLKIKSKGRQQKKLNLDRLQMLVITI